MTILTWLLLACFVLSMALNVYLVRKCLLIYKLYSDSSQVITGATDIIKSMGEHLKRR